MTDHIAADRSGADEREPVAWMTHHDDPMLFSTYDEALDYCEFDEEPIPIYTRLSTAPAAQAEEIRNAARWVAMRELMVAVDFAPEMGGGPVVMFECHAERVMAGPEGADAIADAAIDLKTAAPSQGGK